MRACPSSQPKSYANARVGRVDPIAVPLTTRISGSRVFARKKSCGSASETALDAIAALRGCK